jgi:hypothetical protein
VRAWPIPGPILQICRIGLPPAERIKARAITRCGELLKAIQPASGNQYTVLQEGALPKQTREQAAEDAGLSEHQVRQVSVAKITQAGYRHAAAWCALSKPHRAQIGGTFGGMCEKRRR